MTLVGKVTGSVLKSIGFRRFAQNTAKANEKTFTKMFVNSAKVNAEYSKDALKIKDLGGNKPKPEGVVIMLLKSFKERLSHAIDFLKYRNPADFVAKGEVEQNLGKLIEKKAKTVNVGIFDKSNISYHAMKQIDTEIEDSRKLLKIMS